MLSLLPLNRNSDADCESDAALGSVVRCRKNTLGLITKIERSGDRPKYIGICLTRQFGTTFENVDSPPVVLDVALRWTISQPEGSSRSRVRINVYDEGAPMVVSPALTDDDLIRLSHENPGWQIERIDGKLVMSPPTGGNTGRRKMRLAALLQAYADEHGYEGFDSSSGFHLPNDDSLSPDGALVRKERWGAMAGDREKLAIIVPDVVVELVSPRDRGRSSLPEKCIRWKASASATSAFSTHISARCSNGVAGRRAFPISHLSSTFGSESSNFLNVPTKTCDHVAKDGY